MPVSEHHVWKIVFTMMTSKWIITQPWERKLKKYGPIPASLCLFLLFSRYNFNNTNWKKHRWCAWDSNLGPQDGRRRQNHGAMAATQKNKNLDVLRLQLFQSSRLMYSWIITSCSYVGLFDCERVRMSSNDLPAVVEPLDLRGKRVAQIFDDTLDL